MKKIMVGICAFLVATALTGCGFWDEQVQEFRAAVRPEYEKTTDARELLDKILQQIADSNPTLVLVDGILVDDDLGLPHYEVLDISVLDHFDQDDIVAGYVVRPVITVENPKLLMVVEAADKEAAVRVKAAMEQVKSDQYQEFAKTEIWARYLIDSNELNRQGNFLIYATWNDPADLVKVFQRHVQ